MNRLQLGLARAATILLTLLFWVWVAIKVIVALIGATTVADDYNQLVERLPAILVWLFSTPWWVPAGLATILTAFLIYLAWPRQLPTPATAQPSSTDQHALRDDEQSDDPEKEVDPELYNKLVAFSLDYLVPACEARMDLNDAMLRRGIPNDKIREMVFSSFWHAPDTNIFFGGYCKIHEGLYSTVGHIIRFHALVENIGAIEKTYRSVVDGGDELATAVGVVFMRDLPEQFNRWCEAHRALRDAYEPIKRDSRIPALFRPGKPSRWGDAP